jgi:glyoxylase-like metal-dependent hydrolase (beta-lactamase superfamily II)
MAPMNTLPAFLQPLGHGIHAVDTGFHRDRFDAAYLLVHEGRAAFIDSGTNLAVPRLLASLQALGLASDTVDWVIPTHVHLDHAGGCGLLMQALPHALLWVHPRGVRHMVDPTALWQGALAVYGQAEMERSYGELVPVPANRVHATHDGMTLDLAGRPLYFADTPGHARHHHCIWDAQSRGWFTGDTFGLSYRELDTEQGPFILPTSTPVQFDPPALHASIDRMLSHDPACMYLTHYSRVAEVPRLGALLKGQIDQMVALAEEVRRAPDRHEALKRGMLDIFTGRLQAHGTGLTPVQIGDLLALDLELNAQGIAVWLDR